MKKNILLSAVLGCFLLTGCTSAAPNFIDGKYYMSGDSDCVKGHVTKEGYLKCFNSKGDFTELRNPISEIQAKQWYEDQRALSSYTPVYQAPKRTYCNKVGWSVVCNTY